MGAEPRSLLEKWLEAGDAGDVEAFHHYLRDDVVVRAQIGLASDEPFRLDQVVSAHLRDGKAAEVWEVADVGVLLRQGT